MEDPSVVVPGEKAVMQGISSVRIRSRIIPALALTLVVLLLALLAWAILAPHPQTVSENGRIDAPGQFVPIKGRTAPTFQVADFSGKQLSLSDYRGKVVLLNFWASWCDACKDEAPLLSRVSGTLDGQQAVIIGMDSLDQETDGRDFAKQYGISYTNGFDDSGSVAVDYGVSGMPETFVISPTGQLVGKFYGAITAPDQVTDAIKRATGSQQ
jgi:cytochrome c biogenesis protein CcmG/thiol:disulfide interchange protein DsbE